MSPRDEHGFGSARLFGFVAISLVLAGLLVPIALFTFSVKVVGDSMHPTLREGDRVVVNVLDTDGLKRFDIAEVAAGGGSTKIVKRVIGMPGDQVMVARVEPEPDVFLIEAGTNVVQRVVNPTWTDQVDGDVTPCCTPDGKASPEAGWVTVPQGSYWLIGDNWGGSDDSRAMGFFKQEWLGGTLALRLTPWGARGGLESPATLEPARGRGVPRPPS